MSLFYSPATSIRQIFEAIAFNIAVLEDTIDFPDESGGDVTRELAVPYLAGADEIDVTAASIQFDANLVEQEVITYTAAAGAGGKGVLLKLPRQMYLRSVEISYPDQPAAPVGKTRRTIIRAVGSGVPTPVLSEPSFLPPGEMYPRVMAGLRVTALAGGHEVLSCDGLLGDAWLIQIANASSPTDITALATVPAVHKVTAEPIPSNLTIQMETTDAPVKVWANPNLLLPAAGVQQVSFLALGKRQLQALLKQPAAPGALATLPLRLTFHSDSAGSLGVLKTELQARYHVFPAGDKPPALEIGGDWSDWPLTAPASVPAESAHVDLRVQLAGRELNGGSPDAPLAIPSDGLQVAADRRVAASLRFLPLDGLPDGSVLPLAGIRLFLGATEASEISLELRNDAAGNPGPAAAPPITERLAPGDRGWIEFIPKQPIPVSAGNAPLWVTLRTTRGSVAWYAAPPADDRRGVIAERISTDEAKTWAEPDRPIAAATRLLVQFFHALPDPLPVPVVKVYRRDSPSALGELFAGAVRRGAREFTVSGRPLPPAVAAAFTAATGSGKTTLPFRLYSRSVGTLTVQSAVFVYDPAAIPAGGGLG